MSMRDNSVPHVIPRSCGGRMSCIFLVFIPMLGALTLAGLWMYRTKQAWEVVEIKSSLVREHTLHIGKLLMDFNLERESTVIYVTARSFESQVAAKEDLDQARQTVDESLADLSYWPGSQSEGQMFKSPYLFAAVLDRHRDEVKIGNYFRDELQYYTDVIDVIYGWLSRDVHLFEDSGLWRWMVAYTYLMGSINYLGGEQALCSVFFSIICFSHRETFYYANFSFSGEAAFRMYRQTFPEDRGGGWRTASQQRFFPNLYTCREEIFADMDYQGMAIDPSLCDYMRKNETRFHDLDILTYHENKRVSESIVDILNRELHTSSFDFIISGVILGVVASYFTLLHVLRCTCIKCVQTRGKRKWRPEDAMLEEDKLDSLTLDSKMIKYDEFNHHKPNHHLTVKVATV